MRFTGIPPHFTSLLRTLHHLNPSNNITLYRLVFKAWNKVLIALLQRARNLQLIIKALVYNRSRTGSTFSVPCWYNLFQTILRRKTKQTPTVSPTRNTPCNHDRCNLYVAANLKRGTVKGDSLFYPVCKIFNHVEQHTKHIERALISCPRLRTSLSKWKFLLDRTPAIITTSTILTTLRTQTAQNIVPLLRNICAKHNRLYCTSHPNADPDRYNLQFPLTYALHNVAHTLNIPSSQNYLTNPLPTATQQYKRYNRVVTNCPYPPRSDIPQTPRMCEHCNLLHSHRHPTVPTPANNSAYGVCAMISDTTSKHRTCPACIVYALLHQNTFLQR